MKNLETSPWDQRQGSRGLRSLNINWKEVQVEKWGLGSTVFVLLISVGLNLKFAEEVASQARRKYLTKVVQSWKAKITFYLAVPHQQAFSEYTGSSL